MRGFGEAFPLPASQEAQLAWIRIPHPRSALCLWRGSARTGRSEVAYFCPSAATEVTRVHTSKPFPHPQALLRIPDSDSPFFDH